MLKKSIVLGIVCIVLAVMMGTSLTESSEGANGQYTDGDWEFNVISGTNNANIVKYNATDVTEIDIPSIVQYGGQTYTVTQVGEGSFTPIIANSAIAESGATLWIPSTVNRINSGAFNLCTRLTGALNLPDTVTYIGQVAFQGCSGFSGELNLPSSLTEIGQGAFSSCNFTGTLVMPDSLTEIGKNAFFGCDGFTGLILNNGLTTIGQFAFDGCEGMQSELIIPNSVTSIGIQAFASTNFTGTLVLPENLTTWNGAFGSIHTIDSVYIPEGYTTIPAGVFGYCTSLTTVSLPTTLTQIRTSAFGACTSLTTIYNPSSVVLTPGGTDNGEIAKYAQNIYTTQQNVLNVVVYNPEYGTITPAFTTPVILDVGTQVTFSDNGFSIDGVDYTVSSLTDTPQYDYSLKWVNVPEGTAPSSYSVGIVFEREIVTHNVMFIAYHNNGTWAKSIMTVPYGTALTLTNTGVQVGDYFNRLTVNPNTAVTKYTFQSIEGVTPTVTNDMTILARITSNSEMYAFDIVQPEKDDDATTKMKEGPGYSLLLIVPILAILGLVVIVTKKFSGGDDYNDF